VNFKWLRNKKISDQAMRNFLEVRKTVDVCKDKDLMSFKLKEICLGLL